MLTSFFSFRGRLSRRQYWRSFVLLAVLMVPAFIAPLLIPGLPGWGMAVALAAALLVAGASAGAMTVKRAHDLGRPGRWIFKLLSPLHIAFSKGQAHDNQYGPAPDDTAPRLPVGRWVAGLGLVSVTLFGAFAYAMFAGPSLKWPDCKPAVLADGATAGSARERWRQAVAGLYGPAYADSQLTLTQSTSCTAHRCAFSARPCVRAS
jgi:uncharacterized membrane protein YhaH (DUF805 family)